MERSFFTRTLSGFLSDLRIEVAEELSSWSGFSTLEVNLKSHTFDACCAEPDDFMWGSRPSRWQVRVGRPSRRGGAHICQLTPAHLSPAICCCNEALLLWDNVKICFLFSKWTPDPKL